MRRATRKKCNPCAAYNQWKYFGQPAAPSARAQGWEHKMRPLRSLHPLEQMWAAGGAKGAGPGTENATPAQPRPIGVIGAVGAPRARGAGPGAENATPAQPTPIGVIVGSLGRQGRRAQGQAQRIRPLRSLPAIGVFLGSRAREGRGAHD